MEKKKRSESDVSHHAAGHLCRPVKKLTFKRRNVIPEEKEGSSLVDDGGICVRSIKRSRNPCLNAKPLPKPEATLNVKRKPKSRRGRRGSLLGSSCDADASKSKTAAPESPMQPDFEELSATSTPLRTSHSLTHPFKADSSTPRVDMSLLSYTSFGQDDEALAAVDLTNIVLAEACHSTDRSPAHAKPGVVSAQQVIQGSRGGTSGLRDRNKGCPSSVCTIPVENPRNYEVDKISRDVQQPVVVPPRCSTASNKEEHTFYGLPLKVKELLSQHRGIDKLYAWQHDCLSLEAVKAGKNLIYSLPTSGGKTLVAEILIMKELLIKGKDALLILPFVSIVQEKVKALTEFAVDLEFLVEEYASSKGRMPPRKRHKKRSLYIATIEKANGLVNSLIEEGRLSSIGIVVVDELHMLGEGSGRGATLEMCLSKILFVAKSTQIVGMSATLSNITDLKVFLRAEVYCSDFRPVKLQEYVKVGTSVYDVTDSHKTDEGGQFVRHVQHSTSKNKSLVQQDPDHVVPLVLEIIPQHSCLVFCPTKKTCENLALMLIKFMPSEVKEAKASERQELLKALYNQTNGVCPTLKKTIPFGMAYHHSGLTSDERKLVEDAYSQGTLCLLTCTSTLAAGVNLPAKRVIVRAPYVARELLSRSQYKQMAGRAGRAGIDSSGESILILKEADKKRVAHLFTCQSDSCNSSLLYDEGKGLRALIVTLVGLKLCQSQADIKQFFQTTFLAVQAVGLVSSTHKIGPRDSNEATLEKLINSAVQSLIEQSLIKQKDCKMEGDATIKIEITTLGHASFKGCIDVDASPLVYKQIHQAQENLVLVTELHLLYVVTPLDAAANIEPDWMTYFRLVTRLSTSEQHAADLIGVTEAYLCGRLSGKRIKKDDANTASIKRFYVTLMLYRLMNESTVWEVSNVFQVTRGFLQNLVSSSCTFASCLTHFTAELSEFWGMKLLLEALVKKLTFMSKIELIPLLEVPGVKQARARQLFRAGYKTLGSLARVAPQTLVQEIEHLPSRQAQQIVAAAQMLLSEKADALREEADELTAVPEKDPLKTS